MKVKLVCLVYIKHFTAKKINTSLVKSNLVYFRQTTDFLILNIKSNVVKFVSNILKIFVVVKNKLLPNVNLVN